MDDILDTWETLFNKTLDIHYPWKEKRVSREKQVPWMTKAIINQLKIRDTLLKVARSTNNTSDWHCYRSARSKSVNMIKSAKYKIYSNCFENSKDDSRSMWKIIKSLIGSDTRKKTVKQMPDDDSIERNSADKFNVYFSSIAEQLRDGLTQVPFDNSKLENFVSLRKTQDKNFSIQPFKVEFVLENLASLQSNKVMGVDKISTRTLKIAAPVIALSVVKLLNFSLQSTVCPQRWKTAKVTPIHKSGHHDDVGNYRPVSVLPTLSKILEIHVH